MLKTLVKLQLKLAFLPARIAWKVFQKVTGRGGAEGPSSSSYAAPPATPQPPIKPSPSPFDLQVDPQAVIDRVQGGEEGLVIIDVRQAAEVATGMIQGAMHIPTQDLPRRIEELDDAAAEIFVYCASGVRSLDAAMFLREKGFDKALSLAGGIAHWQSDGGAVVIPD